MFNWFKELWAKFMSKKGDITERVAEIDGIVTSITTLNELIDYSVANVGNISYLTGGLSDNLLELEIILGIVGNKVTEDTIVFSLPKYELDLFLFEDYDNTMAIYTVPWGRS